MSTPLALSSPLNGAQAAQQQGRKRGASFASPGAQQSQPQQAWATPAAASPHQQLSPQHLTTMTTPQPQPPPRKRSVNSASPAPRAHRSPSLALSAAATVAHYDRASSVYSHSALANPPASGSASRPGSRGGNDSPAPLQLQMHGVPMPMPHAARGALPHLSFDVSSLRRLFPSLSHEDVACEVARARDRSKLGGPRGNQAAMVSQTLKALADQVERQRRFDREQGTMSYQVALVAATPRLEPHQSPWLLPLNGPHSRQAGQPVPPPPAYSSGTQTHRPSMQHPFSDAYSPRGSMMINQPPSANRTPRGSVFQHQAHESLSGSPGGSPRATAGQTRPRGSSFQGEVENHFPLPISPQTKHRYAQAHGRHSQHDSKEEHDESGSGGLSQQTSPRILSRRMSKTPIRAPPSGTGSAGPSSQRSSRKHLLSGGASPADATSPRGSMARLKRASPIKGAASPRGVRSGGASVTASQASLMDQQHSQPAEQEVEEEQQPEFCPQFRALESDMLSQFSEAHRKHQLRLSALASEFKARVSEGAQSAGLEDQAALSIVDEQLAEVRNQAALQIHEVELELQEIAAQLYAEAEARQQQQNAAPAEAAEQREKEDETIGFLLQARLSAAQERLALLHAAEAERFQAAMTDAVREAQPTNPAVLQAQSPYHEHLTATLARDLAALQSGLQGGSGSGGVGVISQASSALDDTVKVQKTALIEEALGLKEHVGPEFMRALDDACRLPVARFRALIASQSQLACSMVLRARAEFSNERSSHETALQPCAVKLDGNIEACPLTFLPRGYCARLETFTADAARLIASSLAEAQQEVTEALSAIRVAAAARRKEEQSAARLIQKNFRKHLERGMQADPKRLSSPRSRGSRPLRTGGARPNHAPNPALVAAALTIQRTFRGYWARRIVQRMRLTMVKPGSKKSQITAPPAVAVPVVQKSDAETQAALSPVATSRTMSSVAVGADGPHQAAGPPSILGFDDDEPRSERVAFVSPAQRGAPLREEGYGRASSNFLSPKSAYDTPGRGFGQRGSTPRSGARGPLNAMNLEDSPRYASAEFDPTSPLPPLSHRPSVSGSPSNFETHDEAHAALMHFLMSPPGVVLDEGATRRMTLGQAKQLLGACASSDQAETAQLLYVCLQYLRQMRVMCLAVHPSISSLAAMLSTFRQADVSIEQALQSYLAASWLLPNSAVMSSATLAHVRCLFPKAIVAFRAVKAVHIEERKRLGAHSLGTPLFESEAHLYHALEKYREKSLSKLSQALYEYSQSTPAPLSAPPSSTRIEGLWLAGHGCTRCIINHYLPTIDGAKQAHVVRGSSASSTRFSVHDAAARTHMMRLVQQRTRVAISGALTRMRILPPPASTLHFSLGHILPIGVSNHELQNWELCESPLQEMHAHAPLLNDEQLKAGVASSPCGSPLLIEQLLYWDTQLRAHAAKTAEMEPRSPSSPSAIPADIVSLLFRLRVRPSTLSASPSASKHPKSREAQALFPNEPALLKAVSAEMKALRESAADPDWSESEEQKENECIVASGFEPAPPVAPSRAQSALGRIASTPRAPTPLTALRMPSASPAAVTSPAAALAAAGSSAVASSASAAPVLTGAEFAELPTLTREEQEAIDVQRRADEMVAERAAARAAHAAAEKEAKAAAATALALRQKIAAEREAAAIKIQSLQRGRAVRQEASVRRAIRERQQQDQAEEEERKDRRRTRRRTKAPSSAAAAEAQIVHVAEVAPPDSEVMEVVEVVVGGEAEAVDANNEWPAEE